MSTERMESKGAPREEFTLPPDDAFLPAGTPEEVGEHIMRDTPRGLSESYYARLIAIAIRRATEQAERERDALDAEWKLAMKQRDAWLAERDEWKQLAEAVTTTLTDLRKVIDGKMVTHARVNAELRAERDAARAELTTCCKAGYAAAYQLRAEIHRLEREIDNAAGQTTDQMCKEALRAALNPAPRADSDKPTTKTMDDLYAENWLRESERLNEKYPEPRAAHAPEPEST